MCAQPTELPELTVADRYIPLVTAAYGTRVARPARTTTLPPGGDGSQLDRRVRPALGDDCIVGKPRRRRGGRGELELHVGALGVKR